ncbi:MAG: hypothetical protein EOP01_10920, partial [Propionibacteriaceae bacterium]
MRHDPAGGGQRLVLDPDVRRPVGRALVQVQHGQAGAGFRVVAGRVEAVAADDDPSRQRGRVARSSLGHRPAVPRSGHGPAGRRTGWRLARAWCDAHSDGVDAEAVSELVGEAVGEPEPLPSALTDPLEDYLRELRLRRGLSPHTLRAYRTDLLGLLTHLAGRGVLDLAEVDLRDLRGWLAAQQAAGRARTTLQRRSAAVHGFFRWAEQTGRLSRDRSAALRSPRPHRRLPATLSQAEAVQLLDDALAVAREEDGPVGLRDVALLEVLYATGVRVAELCGLDTGDVDRDRGVLRVFGKGAKERSVPVGRPALVAVDTWLAHVFTGVSGAEVRT